jgi:hypothetical protein
MYRNNNNVIIMLTVIGHLIIINVIIMITLDLDKIFLMEIPGK